MAKAKATTKAAKSAATNPVAEARAADAAKKGKPAAAAKKAAPAVADEPRNAALEKAIRDEPDNDGAYGVYGDWLSEQGHVRGELATAQLSRNQAAAKKLLDKRAPELFGGLAGLVGQKDAVSNVVWRGGFIERARIANTFDRSTMHDGAKPAIDPAKLVGELVRGPGRFLRELTVGIVNYERNHYTKVIDELVAAGPLPTVRSIMFGDFTSEETELNWSEIGDIGRLSKVLPRLQRIKLRSGKMGFKTAWDFPLLKDLMIISGGVEDGAAKLIATAKWPKLEKLDIMFGGKNYGGTTKVPTLAPIFDGKSLPVLRHLGIRNFEFHRELMKPLLQSKILRQIKVLDLSMGTLGDAQAELLLAGKDAIAHLDELIVAENFFTAAGIKQLKATGVKRLTTKGVANMGTRYSDANSLGQRDDEDEEDEVGENRYASVYE